MSNPVFTQDRIDAARGKFDRFWRGESSEPMVSVYRSPGYRQELNPDGMVEAALRCIRSDAAGDEPEILPTFWPDFGTITTAKIWGGTVIPPPPGGCIHIEPVAHTPADLANLRPVPFEQTDFHLAIELYRRVHAEYGASPLFVRTPDFQGPMNTLALLMDQTELMCAMYEAPDLVHTALDHITDVLIAYIGRYMETVGRDLVVGNCWPYLCLPSGTGVAITQDYMPLLGTKAYAEFELPRLKRIADAFGGVWIHCCGTYRQHLRSLKNGGFKIWGLELAYPEMCVEEVYEVFGDEIAYLVGVSPSGETEFPSIIDYARHLSTQPCARARFWFAGCHELVDAAELRRVVKSGFGIR